uniref:Uncharacterized protein n=1 Tax=Sphaerodactylus townsendi TaxID=933632 RepID=A0ACB8F2L1_9SAUR
MPQEVLANNPGTTIVKIITRPLTNASIKNIELKVEVESLKKELQEKQQNLDKAWEAAENLSGQNEADICHLQESERAYENLEKKIHLLREEARSARTEAEQMAVLAEAEKEHCLELTKQLTEYSKKQDETRESQALLDTYNVTLSEKDKRIEELTWQLSDKEKLLTLLSKEKQNLLHHLDKIPEMEVQARPGTGSRRRCGSRCRVCEGRELCGTQRRWLFHPAVNRGRPARNAAVARAGPGGFAATGGRSSPAAKCSLHAGARLPATTRWWRASRRFSLERRCTNCCLRDKGAPEDTCLAASTTKHNNGEGREAAAAYLSRDQHAALLQEKTSPTPARVLDHRPRGARLPGTPACNPAGKPAIEHCPGAAGAAQGLLRVARRRLLTKPFAKIPAKWPAAVACTPSPARWSPSGTPPALGRRQTAPGRGRRAWARKARAGSSRWNPVGPAPRTARRPRSRRGAESRVLRRGPATGRHAWTSQGTGQGFFDCKLIAQLPGENKLPVPVKAGSPCAGAWRCEGTLLY